VTVAGFWATIMLLYRSLRCFAISSKISWRTKSTFSIPLHEIDSCGLPLRPSWSVTQLVSSYPSPTLPITTINRLYELSSLVPPEQGTPNYNVLQQNLEDMVKLVEAVKLVDTSELLEGRSRKEDADLVTPQTILSGEIGQELLKHASRTSDQFYVVDSERRR